MGASCLLPVNRIRPSQNHIRYHPMKSILITGCSSGIGLDAALAFRDAGWLVIASCRKRSTVR